MGFSTEIKEKVLVASARRCCVCKEYKGRNLEVHHIIPKNEGGDDSFDNAIPLCFDCHANAGHYNSKHPKGIKFSPQELKKHRDNWYRLVQEGKFNSNSNEITQQFFVTNSFDIAFEIIYGNMENFPLNEVKLLQNDLAKYIKSINENFRGNDNETNYYKSLEEYKNIHHNAKEITNEWGTSYWERVPTIEELKEKFFDKDYVVNYMIRNGAAPSQIAKSKYNEIGCADGNYETYDIRTAKVVFLALFNTSNSNKYITAITENKISDGGFISLSYEGDTIQKNEINSLLFEPGRCLLIPYCIILSDFNEKITPLEEIVYQNIDTGQSQDIRKIIYDGNVLTIGPRHFIKSIEFETEGFKEDFIVKKFDPKTLLLISRFWECGSCPHLFAKNKKTNKWEYMGEVFSNNPDVLQLFSIKIDNTTYDTYMIKEIENEITRIESISIDKKELFTSLKLKKYEEYIIDVDFGNLLEIKGSYSLINGEKYVNDSKMKNQKILYTIADMNNNDTPTKAISNAGNGNKIENDE